MEPFEIETGSMILRKVTPELIHHFFETMQKDVIMEVMGLDETDYEKYEKMHRLGMKTHRVSLVFFLLVRKAHGTIIGECGFHTWNQSHNRAEIFYSLKYETDRGKGYLTEVLPVVLKYGFNVLNLHRIEALVAEWNTPSVRLLLRNHFVKEGTMREHYLVNGKYEDSDCYSLLKSEYESISS